MDHDRKSQLNNLNIQDQLSKIWPTSVEVITRPNEFFSKMPRSGGFLQPMFFMVAIGLVTGLIHTLLTLINLSPGGSITGLAALILMPLVVAVFGFVGAAILFGIWKVMGSRESYETAYRGMAYTAAIMPVTAVLGIIPYLGGIIGLVWMTYLIVVVSIVVQKIKAKTAWVVFGAICAFFALTSLGAEIAGRKMAKRMDAWQVENQDNIEALEKLQDMSPEEAGKAMGEFLRGLKEASEEKK
jgi:hypothetical protein